MTAAPFAAEIVPSAVTELRDRVVGETAVRINHVSKTFGHGHDATRALDTVSFDVAAGELCCVVGASGCGKSTLLTMLAGLEQPSSGSVAVSGGAAAMMFQDAALFPWLTVEENVEFPLRMHRVSRHERQETVAELLRLVHLDGFARRRPHELSGGMRQRVALARALAQRASVLLMDEPFRALDVRMRGLLQLELERIWTTRGLTILFVTHDVEEAVRLADRIILMAGQPGHVAAEFAVNLPRPRSASDPEVLALAATVTRALWAEGDHAAG